MNVQWCVGRARRRKMRIRAVQWLCSGWITTCLTRRRFFNGGNWRERLQRCHARGVKLGDVSFMIKFFVGGFIGSIGDYFVEGGGKFGFYFELLSFGEGALRLMLRRIGHSFLLLLSMLDLDNKHIHFQRGQIDRYSPETHLSKQIFRFSSTELMRNVHL